MLEPFTSCRSLQAAADALAAAGHFPTASCLEALKTSKGTQNENRDVGLCPKMVGITSMSPPSCAGDVALAAKHLVSRLGFNGAGVSGRSRCLSNRPFRIAPLVFASQGTAASSAPAPAPLPVEIDLDSDGGTTENSDSEHVVPASRQLVVAVESTAVFAAVRVEELVRRAEGLIEAVSSNDGDADGSASGAFSPAIAAATRALTTVLLAARSAQIASIAGTQNFSSVPLPVAIGATQALSQLVNAGRRQRPGALLVPKPGENGAVMTARTALDAALATLLIAATSDIDARLVSEDALGGVLVLLRLHLVSHILPAFDPLDDIWTQAIGGAPAPSATTTAAPKGKSKRVATDSNDVDSLPDDDGDAAPDGATASRGVASKVTKAVLVKAQARVRPVIVAMCEVLSQLTTVLDAVKVADSLLRPLEEVCLLAATQTDASSTHIGSSSAKASAAAVALAEGTAASSPEASLQVMAMACLQRVFLRLPAQPAHVRAALLSELASTHLRSTGGRRFRRAFIVPISVPRPHLLARGGGEPSGSASRQHSESDCNRPMTLVTACTALLCLLLQSAARNPSEDEVVAAGFGSARAMSSVSVEAGAEAAPPRPTDSGDGDLASATGSRAGTKRKRQTKAKAVAVEVVEVSPAPAAPLPAKRSHSKGYADVVRLADFYLGCLFGRLPSEMSAASVDDECDPRLVLRRLLDDLLELCDLPEWPIAELLLQRAVVMLVERLSPRSATSAAAAAATTADRANATLAVQLLGSLLPRLQLARSYALENAVHIPAPRDCGTEAPGPLSSAEDALCICGRPPIEGTLMVDCDVCHSWFHGTCVGLVDAHQVEFWACDDCCIRKELAAQRVRGAEKCRHSHPWTLHAFAGKVFNYRGIACCQHLRCFHHSRRRRRV